MKKTTPCLELIPENPFVYIGYELVLNCTPSQTIDYTASHLEFTHHNDSVIPLQYVHVYPEQNMTQLRYSITKPDDAGHYMCRTKDGKYIGVQNLSLEFYPRPIENVWCIVYNWQTMNCSWNLGDYVRLKDITVSTFWSFPSRSGYNNCSESSKFFCFWNKSAYNEAEEYYLMVNVSHKIETATKIYNVPASKIVKPHPVHQLKIVAKSASCVELSWLHSENSRKLNYSIQYTSIQDKETQITYTTSPKYNVCDLHPYTNYTIDIKAKPEIEGFWSEMTSIQVSTDEDIPNAGPQTTNGSYYITNCAESYRSVYIYFKHVPEFDQNGVISNYSAKTGAISLDASPESYSIKISLQCDIDYIVELYAINGKGRSINNDQIWIPRMKSVNADIRLHVSVSNETMPRVVAHWLSATNDKTMKYTLFWCKSEALITCKSDLNWMTVDGKLSNQTLPLKAGDVIAKQYIFAISMVLNNGVASKMVFSDCLYIVNAVPQNPPKGLKINEKNPDLALRVTWQSNPCDEQTLVGIQYYIIHYCISHSPGKCSGKPKYQKVDSTVSNYQLNDLTADMNYSLWIQAESSGTPGPESERVYGMPTASRLSGGTIAGIICAVVLIFPLVIILIFLRKIKSACTNYDVDNPMDSIDKIKEHTENTSYTRNKDVFIIDSSGKDKSPPLSFDNLSTSISNNNLKKSETTLLNLLPEVQSIHTQSSSDDSKIKTESSTDDAGYRKFTMTSSDGSSQSNVTSKTDQHSSNTTTHSIPQKEVVNFTFPKNGNTTEYVKMGVGECNAQEPQFLPSMSFDFPLSNATNGADYISNIKMKSFTVAEDEGTIKAECKEIQNPNFVQNSNGYYRNDMDIQ